MTTMKSVRHEMLREKWREIIKRHTQSGLPVRQWCEENQVSATQYYYWLRVIREESLIQAGTLAVTGQPQFAEIKPLKEVLPSNNQGTCAFLRSSGHTDMRKSIDGLSAIVSQNFRLDPFQNALFLFCGRRRDRLKALFWEGDGFLLLYKRLENGVFQWPKTTEDVREITPQQYRWLLEGLTIDQKKVIQKVENKRVV